MAQRVGWERELSQCGIAGTREAPCEKGRAPAEPMTGGELRPNVFLDRRAFPGGRSLAPEKVMHRNKYSQKIKIRRKSIFLQVVPVPGLD